MQAALERLRDKIAAAPIDPLPSDNIYLDDVFPEDLYRRIIERLPADEQYDFIDHPDAVLPDGRRTRKLLDLTEATINRLHPHDRDFWREMRELLTAPPLLTAILKKFRYRAAARFGAVLPEMVVTPIFYRDFPGYRIGIHPDAAVKIATMQFYFPRDETQRHLGTSFHRRDGHRFVLHKTNLFKPNAAYAFFRTNESWHSVRQLSVHERVRDSLALTVYVKGSEYRSHDRSAS